MKRRKMVGSDLKFRTKLILGIVIMLGVSSLVTGIMYYTYFHSYIIDNYYSSSSEVTKQIDYYLTEHIAGITNKIDALNNNMTFISAMESYVRKSDTFTYGKELSQVADSLSQLKLSDSIIDSVYVYSDFGDFDDFVGIKNGDFDFKTSDYYLSFAKNLTQKTIYFPQTTDYIYETSYPVIPIIYKKQIGNNIVYYAVALDTSQIKLYFNNTFTTLDNIYIVSGDNNVLNADSPEDMALLMNCMKQQGDCFQMNYDKTDYVVSRCQMGITNWEIYSIRTSDELFGKVNVLQKVIILQLIFAVCIVSLIGAWFSVSITYPLTQLADIMKNARKSGFKNYFEYESKDEIGQLAGNFNEMSDEIAGLIGDLNLKIIELEQEKNNLKVEQEKKRRAQLNALKAQINPHFLYNTLNTISWQAADQGAMDVCILANQLGKFFRTSLNRGREYISVEEEISQVESYLEIQKIRYKNKLEFFICISENIRKYETVNLVLQPLVENAIYHGIKEVERRGVIKISGRVAGKDVIELIVEDNGRGIEPEKLELLNRQLKAGVVDSNSGYGIYNVNERIRLSYGTEYGLCLESEAGVKTQAILKIPMILPYNRMENEYDSDSGS